MRGGLKVLSGADVPDILTHFGFVAIGGKKHIKLRRTGPNGDETVIVPNHFPLAKGTLRAIFSQASYFPSTIRDMVSLSKKHPSCPLSSWTRYSLPPWIDIRACH